jgi:hypothetical protein
MHVLQAAAQKRLQQASLVCEMTTNEKEMLEALLVVLQVRRRWRFHANNSHRYDRQYHRMRRHWRKDEWLEEV